MIYLFILLIVALAISSVFEFLHDAMLILLDAFRWTD